MGLSHPVSVETGTGGRRSLAASQAPKRVLFTPIRASGPTAARAAASTPSDSPP